MSHQVVSAAGNARIKARLDALPSYTTPAERSRLRVQYIGEELKAEGHRGDFQPLGPDGLYPDTSRHRADGQFRFDAFSADIEDHMHRRNDAAASLPPAGFAEDATLTPAQREAITGYLQNLYGEGADGTNSKVNLLSKSDLYLIVRYNSAVQHAKRTAQIDEKSAQRGQVDAKAQALADEKAEGNRGDSAGVRFDAASNERAYRAAAADLNAWRNEPQRADAAAPQDHGGLPHRADAHVLGPVQRGVAAGGTRADADEAYRRSVADLNAWRDE